MTPFDAKLSGLRPPSYSQPLGSIPRSKNAATTSYPEVNEKTAPGIFCDSASKALGLGTDVYGILGTNNRQLPPLQSSVEKNNTLLKSNSDAFACITQIAAKDVSATMDARGIKYTINLPATGNIVNCSEAA